MYKSPPNIFGEYFGEEPKAELERAKWRSQNQYSGEAQTSQARKADLYLYNQGFTMLASTLSNLQQRLCH